MTIIYDLLYQLGVTANYTGFFHTAYAISLCAEQPDRLLLVTKWLYPEVARQYGTNWKAVERNIRTVSCIIWRENQPLLEELAHRHLDQRPRNAEMLSILVSSLDAVPWQFKAWERQPKPKTVIRRLKSSLETAMRLLRF